MFLFKRKPVVDSETADWHVDNFSWLVRTFGGRETFNATALVLPKPGFFTNDGEQGHALALRIFDQVKRYCQAAEWEIDLVVDHNPLSEEVAPAAIMVAPQKHALGMFAVDGNRVQISYVPSLLKRPDRFIATMAHELSHYLLSTADGPPPCAADEMEFLTDLAAVYLGFGVFLANTRFDFEVLQDGPLQGWKMQQAGYLPEADLIFALALFLRARGLEPEPAYDTLKPHLASLLRKALRGLPEDHPYVRAVREAAV